MVLTCRPHARVIRTVKSGGYGLNALMTINVRVVSAEALARMRAMEMQARKTAGGVGAVGRQAQWGLPWLSKWGNQVQWAGRQLMYNFTMPIALAIGAATKFALENEKAMTRVTKVYGDNSKVFNRLAKTEIPALAEAFEALSNKFGVAQKDVINIGADWAAAGASGIALAKSVDLTLQTMILGELDAKTATEQLIAIQAQYGQSTQQLTKTIEILNMVENQTGASMKGLMDGLSRAAGVARTAGVDVEHLAAMMAALVPATGSAASAGNGLKTVISRILSPTAAGVAVMKEMGIEVDRLSWQGMNATERLEFMARSFEDLSKAQQAHVSTVIASRWQINRFVTLMRDVNNENGYYQKSLRATADEQMLFTQRQKELNRVLTSNPQMLKQTWVILQNAMAKVIVPLLPYIVYLAQQLAHMGQSFANLDPAIQKAVLAGFVFLALIGPIARYVGSVTNLIGIMSAAFHFLAKATGISALYNFLFTKSVVTASGATVIQRRGLLGLAAAMLMLPFRAVIAGFRAIGSMAILGAISTMLRSMLALYTFTFTKLFQIVMAQFIAMQRYAAGMVAIPPFILRAFYGLIVGFATIGSALRTVWAASMVAVGRATAILGPAIVAAQAGVIAAFTRFRVIFATLIAGSTGAVGATARIWATLPLIFGAVQAGVAFAFTRFKVMFAALPIMSRVAVVSTAAIWRTLPMLMAAVSLGFQLAIIRMGLMMKMLAVYVRAGILGAMAVARVGMVALVAIIGRGIMALPLMVARIGPMLLAGLSSLGSMLGAAITAVIALITSPWGIAFAAVLGVAYAFRDKLEVLWRNVVDTFHQAANAMPGFFQPVAAFFQELGQRIMDAFWALPEGVRNAMIAVLTVVRDAALQVYEWMSYLNPFARHSPSLVENVTKGMDVIGAQYGRAKGFGGPMKQLHAQLEAAIRRQEAVVDSWKHKLDAANHALDEQQWVLDGLKDKLDQVQSAYDAHKASLENYASAPIKGMQEMQNQIFQNELAQKRLRLEMLKWQQENGGSVDDVRNRLALLYGDIEKLKGRANELRMKGAGSDVLGPINDQIAAMEAQAQKLRTAVSNNPVDKLQKQMDELQVKGDIMQLQFDIKYDPMTHAIEQMANAQKELSYDEIINGIQRERDAMNQLQPRLDRYTNAVAAQQAVVDRMTRSRDAIQRRYDAENDKLQHMKDRLQDVTDKMQKMKAASDELSKKKKPYVPVDVETFRAGEGANWADPGTFRKIGRQGGLQDQSQMIRDFAEQTNSDLANIFGSFDMFAPLKSWWRRTWAWLKENVGPVVQAVVDGVRDAFGSMPNPFDTATGGKIIEGAKNVWDTISDIIRTVWGWIKKIIRLFAPDFKRIWDSITKGAKRVWKEIGPELAKFGKLFVPITKALKALWWFLKPVVAIIGGALLLALKVAAGVISRVFGPVLDLLITSIKNIIRVIRGMIEVVVGILTGDWKMAWQGIKDIVGAAFDQVAALIGTVGKVIWGIVKGVVMGVVDFFKWLYDVLVGHSIVPDLVNGVIRFFKLLARLPKWVWNNVLKPIFNFFRDLWTDYVRPALKAWWSGIKAAWNKLQDIGTWIWKNVLKPVFNWFKDLWSDYVRPALRAWWENVKANWDKLKGLGRWIWENALKPVWTKVKSLWADNVKPALRGWWEGIKGAWDKLKGLGTWVWNNVMTPVFNKIKDGWTRVKTWLTDNKDMLTAPAKGIVNAVIKAVNFMIRGLNKISDILPGIDFHIEPIKLLAAGGDIPTRRVGSGFKTNGARAIVGEGKSNYPEFVIPTDPTHRRRALMLHTMAGKRLGAGSTDFHGIKNSQHKMNGVPAFSIGGWIGDIGKKAWNGVKSLKKNAVNLAWSPFDKIARDKINDAKWIVPRQIGLYGLNKVGSWVGATNKQFEDARGQAKKKYEIPKGGSVQVSDPSNPRGLNFWHGGTFSNRFIAHMAKAEKLAGQTIHVMQGGFRPATSYSGTSHQGDAVDLQVSYGLIKALRQVGIAAGDRTGLGNWGPHVHAIPGPSAGYAAGSAVWQWQDYMAKGGMNQPYNSTWGLANGAIIKGRRGGVNARIGEGMNDELVTPLPRNWRTDTFGRASDDRGGNTYIEKLEITMPNITSGDDAELFLKNLELLTKD